MSNGAEWVKDSQIGFAEAALDLTWQRGHNLRGGRLDKRKSCEDEEMRKPSTANLCMHLHMGSGACQRTTMG